MKKVIIFESLVYVRYRLKELLAEDEISVIEASNSMEFFNKLYKNKNSIQLIILEVNLWGEDGIGIIKKIKDKNIDIPIMVVTTENSRNCFVKCIKNGVVDYILKPYENNMILNRVKGCINNNGKWGGEQQELIIDYKGYLQKSIDKAKKNNKQVSIILVAFLKKEHSSEKLEINEEYLILNDLIYKTLNRSIIKPSVVSKLGFSTFIFVLPTYEKEKVSQLEKVIGNIYKDMTVADIRLKGYYLRKARATFPEDGQDSETLMDICEKRLTEIIGKEK